MSFRLRPQESVARGLRRLALKELRSAHDELRRSDSPKSEAIHATRKSVKKVRAIFELIDADRGHGLAARNGCAGSTERCRNSGTQMRCWRF